MLTSPTNVPTCSVFNPVYTSQGDLQETIQVLIDEVEHGTSPFSDAEGIQERAQTLCQQAFQRYVAQPDQAHLQDSIIKLAIYSQPSQQTSELPSFVVKNNLVSLAKFLVQNGFQPEIAQEDAHFCGLEMRQLLSPTRSAILVSSAQPSVAPSMQPSARPTEQPTSVPTTQASAYQAKFFPYQPQKHQIFSLNGMALFAGTDEKIVCRHLALAWLQALGSLKTLYEKFSSVESITESISRDVERQYQHLRNSATECHLISNNDLGKLFIDQFKAMRDQGLNTRKILLCSTTNRDADTHAMAVWLTTKVEANGETAYVVHFYDPNFTTTHTRAKTYDLEPAKSNWTLGAFLNHQSLPNGRSIEQSYYPDISLSVAYVVPDSWDAQSALDDLNHQAPPNRVFSSHDIELNAASIHYLLKSNFPATLGELKIDGVDGISALPEPALFAVLAAKRPDGVAGLYNVMLNGNADAIRAYRTLLKNSGVSNPAFFKALAGEGADHFVGLYVALHNGHTEAIKAYGELLQDFDWSGSEQDLLNLIDGRNSSGTLALYFAFKHGHVAAAHEYCRLIDSLVHKLSPAQCRALFVAMKASQSENGILRSVNHAYYNNIKKTHPEFYAAFKHTKSLLKLKAGWMF